MLRLIIVTHHWVTNATVRSISSRSMKVRTLYNRVLTIRPNGTAFAMIIAFNQLNGMNYEKIIANKDGWISTYHRIKSIQRFRSFFFPLSRLNAIFVCRRDSWTAGFSLSSRVIKVIGGQKYWLNESIRMENSLIILLFDIGRFRFFVPLPSLITQLWLKISLPTE